MKVEGFVIHLARATQRRGLVDRLLAASPVPMHVIDAVDGRAMTEAALLERYSREPLHPPTYPFRLGAGEIACFLSHRAIWQRMIEDGVDFALILEDDVQIDAEQVARVVDLVSARADRDAYVELQTRPVPASEIEAQGGGVSLLRPDAPPLRTSAQIVGLNAARRLLAVSERFDRPIDCLLQLVTVTGQDILCAVPSGVRDASDAVGGSVAQAGRRRGLGEWLLREWRRFHYRRKVRRILRATAMARQRGQRV